MGAEQKKQRQGQSQQTETKPTAPPPPKKVVIIQPAQVPSDKEKAKKADYDDEGPWVGTVKLSLFLFSKF